MPKRRFVKKRSKDKKQDNRIKTLEKFIFKTIENKQVNYAAMPAGVSSGGSTIKDFLKLATGAEDGADYGDAARIGNTITLMNQRFGFNFIGSSTDTFNQFRVILVESVDGNQDLVMSDVLLYHSWGLHGDNVFSSPYTTKSNTNKRYKIHMDKCFTVSGLATKGGIPPAKVLVHKIRYGKTGKLVEYNGPGQTLPINHKINLLVISDSVSAAHPTMSYNVRRTYKDA